VCSRRPLIIILHCDVLRDGCVHWQGDLKALQRPREPPSSSLSPPFSKEKRMRLMRDSKQCEMCGHVWGFWGNGPEPFFNPIPALSRRWAACAPHPPRAVAWHLALGLRWLHAWARVPASPCAPPSLLGDRAPLVLVGIWPFHTNSFLSLACADRLPTTR
jgi:hypothetical protein